MPKSYIIGLAISIIAGLLLCLSVYVFTFYIIFLLIVSISVVFVVLISLYRRTTHWKIALPLLGFGYLAALTAYLTFDVLEFRNEKKGDTVISELYRYRQKMGKFPSRKNELPYHVASIKGNYVPDSSLTRFKFYYRNLYGIPKIFSSIDSSWIK